MKRFRLRLIRRLAPPELGEIRRMGGIEWVLVSINSSLILSGRSQVTLTYVVADVPPGHDGDLWPVVLPGLGKSS